MCKHLLPRKMFPRATRSTILNYQHENSSLHNENGYPHECNMNIFCVKRTATFVLSYATLHYITLHTLGHLLHSPFVEKFIVISLINKMYSGIWPEVPRISTIFFTKKPNFYSTEAVYSQVVLRPYPQEANHLGQLWIKLQSLGNVKYITNK